MLHHSPVQITETKDEQNFSAEEVPGLPHCCSSLQKTISSSVPATIDDFKVFKELLKHMAETLAVVLQMVQEKAYKLFDILQSQDGVSLPINEGVLELTEDVSATPASASVTSKDVDYRYQVLPKASEYFYTYPSPSSLVITAANEKSKQLGKSATQEKELSEVKCIQQLVCQLGQLIIKLR